ncbi:hypothetical protein CEXT_346311 [Caerostris extrusa]|uniref:Uncharacterized protein n=1 Tax=Caerostris extrusa TaxID=172846 RepID=A0AAV4Q1D5_CAEEX|nr:hypothetical protein CEXT_346311 [Caerostris extrusa]
MENVEQDTAGSSSDAVVPKDVTPTEEVQKSQVLMIKNHQGKVLLRSHAQTSLLCLLDPIWMPQLFPFYFKLSLRLQEKGLMIQYSF